MNIYLLQRVECRYLRHISLINELLISFFFFHVFISLDFGRFPSETVLQFLPPWTQEKIMYEYFRSIFTLSGSWFFFSKMFLDVRLYNWTQFFSSYSWIAFCNSLKEWRVCLWLDLRKHYPFCLYIYFRIITIRPFYKCTIFFVIKYDVICEYCSTRHD